MNTALISLILSLVELVSKETPQILDWIAEIKSKGDPSPADWDALRARVNALTLDDV